MSAAFVQVPLRGRHQDGIRLARQYNYKTPRKSWSKQDKPYAAIQASCHGEIMRPLRIIIIFSEIII